ncbi:unnamed protein product [Allacma fusca]|uniref:Uncharacterized protein n=1 Tax=Allacma fusca TaxID=39272 RepID=A0A8J2PHK3_9HEXA|nr:unnamed protein product [Allacma fusca]
MIQEGYQMIFVDPSVTSQLKHTKESILRGHIWYTDNAIRSELLREIELLFQKAKDQDHSESFGKSFGERVMDSMGGRGKAVLVNDYGFAENLKLFSTMFHKAIPFFQNPSIQIPFLLITVYPILTLSWSLVSTYETLVSRNYG